MSRRARRADVRRFVVTASLARTPSEGLSLALVLLCVQRGVSPAWAGILVAATSFPQVLSGPFLGSVLDRTNNIWTGVRVAAALTAAAAAGLAVGIGNVPIGIAVVLCAVVAFVEPTFSGGISAAADRTLVSGPQTAVHAWDSFSYNVAGLLAPALVTVVAAVSSASAATAALAATVIVGSVTSQGLRTRPQPEAPGPGDGSTGRAVRLALAAIWRAGSLRAVTLSTTLAFVGFGGLTFAAVAATRAAGRSTADAGQLFTVLAVGGLLGSWLMTRRPSPLRPVGVVAASLGAMGVVLAAMAATHWWPALLVGAFALGLLDGPLLVGLFAARVSGAPAELRTTVFTLGASAKLGASAVGAVLGGQLLGGRATTAGFAVVGIVHVVAAGLCWEPGGRRGGRGAAGVAR